MNSKYAEVGSQVLSSSDITFLKCPDVGPSASNLSLMKGSLWGCAPLTEHPDLLISMSPSLLCFCRAARWLTNISTYKNVLCLRSFSKILRNLWSSISFPLSAWFLFLHIFLVQMNHDLRGEDCGRHGWCWTPLPTLCPSQPRLQLLVTKGW